MLPFPLMKANPSPFPSGDARPASLRLTSIIIPFFPAGLTDLTLPMISPMPFGASIEDHRPRFPSMKSSV